MENLTKNSKKDKKKVLAAIYPHIHKPVLTMALRMQQKRPLLKFIKRHPTLCRLFFPPSSVFCSKTPEQRKLKTKDCVSVNIQQNRYQIYIYIN